jgi:hypothetical protein
MCFEWKFDFYKPVKTHIRDHHVLQIQNMGVTAKKYGVSVSFCRKLTIFGKIVGLHLSILSENLNFLKTHENSYTRPLYINDLEYVGHDQEIQSFCQVLPQTGYFQ